MSDVGGLTLLRLVSCAALALWTSSCGETGPLAVSADHCVLNVSDISAQKEFLTLIGGREAAAIPGFEVVEFPALSIRLRAQAPSGGSRGSSLNHIGFQVRDVHDVVRRAQAAGHRVITQQDISGGRATSDIFHSPSQDVDLAFLLGPDGLKVEVFGVPELEAAAAAHHLHLNGPDVAAMGNWYAERFGAELGTRGPFEEARIPGMRITFSQEDGVSPTRGRVIDAIGLRVPGSQAPPAILDPSGTRIEFVAEGR